MFEEASLLPYSESYSGVLVSFSLCKKALSSNYLDKRAN